MDAEDTHHGHQDRSGLRAEVAAEAQARPGRSGVRAERLDVECSAGAVRERQADPPRERRGVLAAVVAQDREAGRDVAAERKVEPAPLAQARAATRAIGRGLERRHGADRVRDARARHPPTSPSTARTSSVSSGARPVFQARSQR